MFHPPPPPASSLNLGMGLGQGGVAWGGSVATLLARLAVHTSAPQQSRLHCSCSWDILLRRALLTRLGDFFSLHLPAATTKGGGLEIKRETIRWRRQLHTAMPRTDGAERDTEREPRVSYETYSWRQVV